MTAREAIAAGGGLVSMAGLARRWNVTHQAVRKMRTSETFPKPTTKVDGRSDVWLVHEADAWRNARLAKAA